MQPGILGFHDDIEQHHGDILCAAQQAERLGARLGVQKAQSAALETGLAEGELGHHVHIDIIIDYDINDFWCKTDLSTRKLFTTVITSLRTYATLREAQQQVAELAAALAQCGDAPTAPAADTP